MGPFKLVSILPNKEVNMLLKSTVADVDIKMIFNPLSESQSELSMEVITDPKGLIKRTYWFVIKPFHKKMSFKMLNIFKQEIEDLKV